MKFFLTVVLGIFCYASFSQTLQLHYDARHTLDPRHNTTNYPTLYFEYFKAQDSGKSFIKPGSFLLKMQADFSGVNHNMGKFYMQVSQSFRFWKPKIFLSLQYSGGLGITEPKEYSYYITNTFSGGIDIPFRWGKAYMSSVLDYKYIPYKKPSNDFLYTLYWWRGLWNYKGEFSGNFSLWTENKNHGDAYMNLKGKRFYFFAEPQFWHVIYKNLSAGTKVNMYYHVLTNENLLQVYPTIAIRCKI